MRRYAYVVALVAVAGCGSVNVEQEREALLAADREWSQTVTDVDKFTTYLATDATFYPPGMPAVTGTDAIRKTFGEMSSAPGFSLSWTADEAVVAASGDIGYTSGKYTSSMAGGTEQGKYVTVWKKEGDAWKVTEDIFNADSTPQAASSHVMMSPGEFKWTDAPPSLPPGARIAVVSGDPTQAGAFVLRAQVPAGYKVPPHWHPGVENLTVISGTIALGMGEQWDEATMTTVATGGYASLPAEMRHSFLAKSAATFQVDGMGPFVVNYVNPADDPSKQK
jgi:ketosteroid isomerase-like protein/quercetin dioxygenase-like cupin family protein